MTRLLQPALVVHSMHPGWADTPGIAASLPTFRRALGPALRSPEQGADTTVWLAAAPAPGQTSGELWHDRATRAKHYLPWSRESTDERAEFYDKCEELV